MHMDRAKYTSLFFSLFIPLTNISAMFTHIQNFTPSYLLQSGRSKGSSSGGGGGGGGGGGSSGGARTPPSSPDNTPNTHMALSESDDSSLNSMEIDERRAMNEDSDTGLESMSSAETPKLYPTGHHLPLCPLCGGGDEGGGGGVGGVGMVGSGGAGAGGGICALHMDPETIVRQVDTLKHEINKLKCDKLDLLRQNVVSGGSSSSSFSRSTVGLVGVVR